jgi:hypothetical protein
VEEQRLLTDDLPRRYRIEAVLEIAGHVPLTITSPSYLTLLLLNR